MDSKKTKIWAKILLSGMMMSLMLSLNIATTSAPAFAALGCDNLKKADSIKDYIITIMEERINPPGTKSAGQNGVEINTNKDEGVLNCFRQTTQTDKGPTEQYVSTCKPGDKTTCQPVQVIYAKSGASLIFTYVGLIYRWAAGTAGVITVLYLVVAGIMMASSQGDAAKYEKAKEYIMNSIAGLVLLFLSALILYTINPNFFTI